MKKSTGALALVLAAVVSTGAVAVDLVNKDSKTYNVKFEDGPSTLNTSITGSTSRGGVCSKCKVIVEGVGSVEVAGNKTVVIKDGKLSTE